MQETGSRPVLVPDSGGAMDGAFAELDLALVDALQADPRAPWSRVGPALGVDATTAARHWDRLVQCGLAWVTAYAAPGVAAVGYVEMRCKPSAVERLVERLAGLPWVFSIEHVVGDFDLFLSVCAADLPALGRLVSELGLLRGVRSTRTRLALRHYVEGSRWHVRALAADRIAALLDVPAQPAAGPKPGSARVRRTYDEVDVALLLALGGDGRATTSQLAQHTGFGESTVRRRLARQLRDGDLLLRCDLAQPLAGWPVIVTYQALAPHRLLERVGLTIAHLPQTRLCASVTGASNLVFSVWLRGTADITAFESLLAERVPDLRVQERTVTLRTAKRMGRVLDRHGRAVGHVPLMIPPIPA